MEDTNYNKLNTHQRNKSSINMNSNKHSRNISNYMPIPKDDSINSSKKIDHQVFTEETKETKELKEVKSLSNSDKNGKITSENTAFKPKVSNLLLLDDSNDKGLNNFMDMKEDSSVSSKSIEVINQNGLKNVNISEKEKSALKEVIERRNKRIKTRLEKEKNEDIDNKRSFIKLPKEIVALKNKLLEHENENVTEELFSKIQFDEVMCGIIIVLSIFNSCIYREYCYSDESKCNSSNDRIVSILIINTILFVIYVIINIVRHINYYRLYRSAQYIYLTDSYFYTNLFLHFIIEFILSLFHPNLILLNKKWTTNKFLNLKVVEYHSNDFLVILQIFRAYLLANVFITMNDFYSARADRVSKLISTKLDFFLSFKLTYKDKPVTCIVFLTFISCFSLAYMLRIVEGPVSKDVKFGDPSYDKNNYELFSNSLWNVLVIYTTVGYGEFFPKTTLGMCVCVITSLYGIMLVSIIIMTMQNLSQFNKREYCSKDLIDRLKAKNDLIEPSRNYFIENLRYLVIQNKYLTKLKRLEKEYGEVETEGNNTNQIDLSRYIKNQEEKNNYDVNIDNPNHDNINTEMRLNNDQEISEDKSKIEHLKKQIVELKSQFSHDMEKIFISKIEKKRELKKGLKDYYRDYMKYDPLDEVKEQVETLEQKMSKMEEKNVQIEKLLRSFLNKISN